MTNAEHFTAHAFKDNFWSKLRVEKGYKIREVAECIGKSEKQTGMYFSGQQLPNPATIALICDLFGVDFQQGTEEFVKANDAWKAENSRTVKISKKTRKSRKKELPADVVKVLYDVLDYAEFNDFFRKLNNRIDDPLELVYHKVDCDVYVKILQAVLEYRK